MRILLIAFLISAIAGGVVCAEEKNFTKKDRFCVIERTPQAKGPVGAVVETAGVFVGKIASAVEIACTGERKITVENETGNCKIFPFCTTTKIADKAFNTVTFNQLKAGEKVRVEYTEDSGAVKTEKVIIEKDPKKADAPAVKPDSEDKGLPAAAK